MGEQVGAGNVALAKKHAVTHITFAVFVMLIIMSCLRIWDDGVAALFTEQELDQAYIKEVMNVLSVYLILDAVHGVNSGIVRALGKQFIASVATILCYYLVGMTLALVLGFKFEMGLVGFWLGFMIAMFLLDVVVTVIIITADWEIGSKHGDSALRLTRRNSASSYGSTGSKRKTLLEEPILSLKNHLVSFRSEREQKEEAGK